MVMREITVEETWPLRQRVLRPGQPLSAVQLAEDGLPLAFHLGAIVDGEVVGVASFYQQPGPPELLAALEAGALPAVPPAVHWRLRQMATAPEVRGLGYGAALLGEGAQRVARRGGGLLWFDARSSACSFYEKSGYQVLGREYEIPGIGPHFLMWGLLPVIGN
jgi:L-Ala-D/L-Glu epimerase